MNRVRILFLGVLALFVCINNAVAAGCNDGTGNCKYIYFQEVGTFTKTDYYSVLFQSITDCKVVSVQKGSNNTIQRSGKQYYTNTYSWNGAQWFLYYQRYVFIQDEDIETFRSAIENAGGGEVAPAIAYPNGIDNCGQNSCDNSDSDNDGICNSCDTLPGLPDKKHCAWQTLVVAGSNQVAMMDVDKSGNCDGSQTELYQNNAIVSQVQSGALKAYWHGNKSEFDPPSCQGDDGTGNCRCGYPSSNPLFADMQSSEAQMSAELKDQLTQQDQAANDDKYDDCASIKHRCEAACLTRGGVVNNTCTVSGDKTYASCECKQEFAFDIAAPTETPPDTSTGGDVAQTGGNDSNADGKDDAYAAMKDALNDSGLNHKLDSTNDQLNNIGNSIGSVGQAINGVGSAVDGLADGIAGLGNQLGGKLDGLGDSLDDIKDKLGDGITLSGNADIPNENTYDPTTEPLEEDSFYDAVTNFITSGLPLIDFFRDSKITHNSGSSSFSVTLFGQEIGFDFAPYADIFSWIGLVLVFISTIIAFRIITNT